MLRQQQPHAWNTRRQGSSANITEQRVQAERRARGATHALRRPHRLRRGSVGLQLALARAGLHADVLQRLACLRSQHSTLMLNTCMTRLADVLSHS